MKKALEVLLVRIFTDEIDNDDALISRSLAALSAAGLRAEEADVRGALLTCDGAESYAWDLMRAAGLEE
jgi:hypothetical protein